VRVAWGATSAHRMTVAMNRIGIDLRVNQKDVAVILLVKVSAPTGFRHINVPFLVHHCVEQKFGRQAETSEASISTHWV